MEKVKANITVAQTRQKEQYDKKHHNPDIFTKGALVLQNTKSVLAENLSDQVTNFMCW